MACCRIGASCSPAVSSFFSARFCFMAGVWRELWPGAPPPQPDVRRIPAKALVALNGFLSLSALRRYSAFGSGGAGGGVEDRLLKLRAVTPGPRSEKSQSGRIARHASIVRLVPGQTGSSRFEHLFHVPSLLLRCWGALPCPLLRSRHPSAMPRGAPATHETRNVPTNATAPSQRNTALTDQGNVRASKLIGSSVYNDRDQKVGSVDDVILGKENRANVVIVSVGGFLGMGTKLVAVPY